MDDTRASPSQKDTSQVVRISERAMNKTFLIENTEIAQEITVPSDISVIAELLPTLMMEAWNQELTPDERHSLCGLLPEGHSDDSAVMSIFSGGTSRFGIDRAGNWLKSVCEGKENPDAVLKRDMDFKILRQRFLMDLQSYHEGFIENAERYKRLWSETCEGDDEKFNELIRRV